MLPDALPQVNPVYWNNAIAQLPGAHILQTWEWGEVKSHFEWQPNTLLWSKEADHYRLYINQLPDHLDQMTQTAAALVLIRQIKIIGFSHWIRVMYIPKGPMLDWNDSTLRHSVLQDLRDFARNNNAIFIKIDPDVEVGTGVPGKPGSNESQLGKNVINDLISNGWHFSNEQVQFRNTILIDLTPSEDVLLSNMKQKTRYNINLAIRKGVSVRSGNLSDIESLFQMYAETSERDGFIIRNEAYYRRVWNTFLARSHTEQVNQPIAEALLAEVNGEVIAGTITFRFGKKAWFLYGMSRFIHREKMPNYLLQWEAIKRSKLAGCTLYDLWGAPDEFVETDPLWGVFRFKEGLGGSIHRNLGAWDLPLNRMLYRLYTKTLPGLIEIMRKRGKTDSKQTIGLSI